MPMNLLGWLGKRRRKLVLLHTGPCAKPLVYMTSLESSPGSWAVVPTSFSASRWCMSHTNTPTYGWTKAVKCSRAHGRKQRRLGQGTVHIITAPGSWAAKAVAHVGWDILHPQLPESLQTSSDLPTSLGHGYPDHFLWQNMREPTREDKAEVLFRLWWTGGPRFKS